MTAPLVLITGARSAAAVDLARDFAAAGWLVHMADSIPAMIARTSRAPTHVHRYAPPRQQPRQFRDDIAGLMARLAPAMVVPTCEELFHLAQPALAQVLAGRLFAPPIDTLTRLHDKAAFADLAGQIGLAVPETHRLTEPVSLKPFGPSAGDWVFKPAFSRFGQSALIGPPSSTLAGITPSPSHPWLAQRRVRGEEICTYAVARQGRLTAFAAYRSGWRLKSGASFAFVPVGGALASRLEAAMATLAEATAMTGQIACDVIVDADDQCWLIECNPRSTSGVHLLCGGGRLAAAMSGAGSETVRAGEGSQHMLPAMLAIGLPQALRRRRFRQWKDSLATGIDAVGRPGDRLPVAGALIDSAAFMWRALRQGISPATATTSDICWNGEPFDRP